MLQSNIDVLIVGGGITGLSFAALLADSGRSVVLIRRSDTPVPQAEALRNQGWLQTGFMYMSEIQKTYADVIVNDVAITTAMQMYAAGNALHQKLRMGSGYGVGTIPAILHVPEKRKRVISENVDLIRATGNDPVWASIQPASDELLKHALGENLANDFAANQASNFTLPDRSFDEAAILRRLRSEALANGAGLYTSVHPVTAERNGSLRVGDLDLPRAKITIVAAGMGSTRLLRELGQAEMYKIRQTAMLVTKKLPYIRTPILVDLENGFSLVNPPGDKCVVGTSVRDFEVVECDSHERQISSDSEAETLKRLPAYLVDHARENGFRFTAGRELIPKWELECHETRQKTENPNLRMHLHNQAPHRVTDSNCWIVNPGRATTAFTYADSCIYSDDDSPNNPYFKIAQAMPVASGEVVADLSENYPYLNKWTEKTPIHMHFESFYESLDDRESL